MAAFLALVRKDLILFLRDRRALIINLIVPIVIAAFFGSRAGGAGKAGRIDVALVQQKAKEERGDVGKRIADGLAADPNLRVTAMTLPQAEAAVRKGAQAVAIVLPSGFGEAAGAAMFGTRDKPAIRLLYDPSQPAVLAMVKGMLTQQVMSVVSAEMFGGKMGTELTETSLKQLEDRAATDPESRALRDMLASVRRFQALPSQASAKADGAGPKRGLTMPFETRDEQLSGTSVAAGYNGYAHAFAGMGVQFILFMAINMGIDILLSRRSGVWNRLLAAPVSMPLVLLARAASAALIAAVLLCVIFAVAVLGFGVTVSSVAGLIGIAVSFGMLTAGFGLLIAAFGKTPEAARGIAVFATLMLVMLSGAWMPSFLFPAWVQKVTLAVPTRWAIDGLDAVTWRGLDFAAALPAIGVQAAFAVAFMAIAVWKFRRT
jgi:ABC-2 type transport system permease protein